MADASTVNDSPGLLESALAFLRGETVAKSALLTAQARAAQFESSAVQSAARVKELETEATTAKESLANASARGELLSGQVKDLTAKVAALEATAQTGARQAAVILSQCGISPVTAGTETARDQAAGSKTFGQ